MDAHDEIANLRGFFSSLARQLVCYSSPESETLVHHATHSSILLSNWSKHETDRKGREGDQKKKTLYRVQQNKSGGD